MQGGPLHSDGSGSSQASSVHTETPFVALGSFRPRRGRVLPVVVLGLVRCRCVVGNEWPNTTTTLKPRREGRQYM